MKKKWLIVGLAAVVLVGGVVAARVLAVRKAAAAQAYQTAVISSGELVGTVGATGTVRADQSAILQWQTSGVVEKVDVSVGDIVAADAILASLEKTSLAQNIILAEADLAAGEKALDELQQNKVDPAKAWASVYAAQDKVDEMARKRRALNYEITYTGYQYTDHGRVPVEMTRDATPAEIDEADANLAVAQAELDRARREYERLKNGPDPRDLAAAEARVAAARAALNQQYISAPFKGTITEVLAKPGDLVKAGSASFRIDDLSRLLVDVRISEVDINQVKPGQEVSLSFDAVLNREYHGVVSEVARVGTSDAGVVNFLVTVELTDADIQVLPQMTAAVNIVVVKLENVLLVPNRAVRLVEGQRVVYLLKNGQPVKSKVELGASSDLMSELVGGEVKQGDVVILNPPTTFFMGPRGGPMGN